jgi:hypothetical protein
LSKIANKLAKIGNNLSKNCQKNCFTPNKNQWCNSRKSAMVQYQKKKEKCNGAIVEKVQWCNSKKVNGKKKKKKKIGIP